MIILLISKEKQTNLKPNTLTIKNNKIKSKIIKLDLKYIIHH